MTCRLITNESGFSLANKDGDLTRRSGGEVFLTTDADLAAEALAYLNKPRMPGKNRTGSHRCKSLFGVTV